MCTDSSFTNTWTVTPPLPKLPSATRPLTDTLPPPVQRLIAIYHNNVQRAQNHTRLALNAIDTLARFPPAAYFTDPNLGTQASPHPHTQADPLPSSVSPLRFYPIPTAAARHTTVQDAATQTFPPSVSIMANPLQPLLLHESQQTTPRPHTHHRHIQTDIHAIVQLPSFAGIMPTPEANQPDSSIPTTSMAPTASPNPTSAANKQPHDRWQYVNLIPTPTVKLHWWHLGPNWWHLDSIRIHAHPPLPDFGHTKLAHDKASNGHAHEDTNYGPAHDKAMVMPMTKQAMVMPMTVQAVVDYPDHSKTQTQKNM